MTSRSDAPFVPVIRCQACDTPMVGGSTARKDGRLVCPNEACAANKETPLPESWKKPALPVVPDVVSIPTCSTDDPAQLESWFGPFGLAEAYRKVVLSSASEIIRAQHAGGPKPSEDRIDDLAHLHPAYLAFLVMALKGRTARENEVLKRGLGS